MLSAPSRRVRGSGTRAGEVSTVTRPRPAAGVAHCVHGRWPINFPAVRPDWAIRRNKTILEEGYMSWTRSLCVAAGAALITAAVPIHAQTPITLPAIDGYPPRALWIKEFLEFYIQEVDKRLAKE